MRRQEFKETRRQEFMFSNVTINNSLTEVESADGTLAFVGAYSPLFIGQEDKNLLYLGADNKLYYPNGEMTIGSCRAHFRLQGIEAGDPATANVKAFVLNFDDETTGIWGAEVILQPSTLNPQPSTWFTLDGRRLNSKPTAKGIYIYGNKKIVIK